MPGSWTGNMVQHSYIAVSVKEAIRFNAVCIGEAIRFNLEISGSSPLSRSRIICFLFSTIATP
nr:hypothetical protein Q903MT_gene2158 [Picea sitchensis]